MAWLCSMSPELGRVDPTNVRLVEPPQRQWEKIDVKLEVEVAGKRVRLIIEDKTESGPHGEQLKKYAKVAEKDGVQLAKIYFKTGYHFGEDLAARKDGYQVVGLPEWIEFLRGLDLKNDILEDYRRYMTGLLDDRTRVLGELLSPSGFGQFRHAFAQYEFLRRLEQDCPGTLERGTNVGGEPWTHLKFSTSNGAVCGMDEHLFHRIDRRQHKGSDGQKASTYYLSTRQHALVKGNPGAKREKLQRLRWYRSVFKDAVEAAGTQLRFAAPAADHRGANESEIGVMFFDGEANTTEKVLAAFPLVHRAFLERIGELPPFEVWMAQEEGVLFEFRGKSFVRRGTQVVRVVPPDPQLLERRPRES